MSYEPVIGLEVHVELATKSKMFCGCQADHFGREPNTITCPVCLGLPGALPVPNKKAVEWTILLGLALGCTINDESKFDRKHYYYPDLPKGYQISQYDEPIAINGQLVIPSERSESRNLTRMRDLKQVEGSLDFARDDKRIDGDDQKTVRIRRVHLEEDTGKLQHAVVDGRDVSLVDFNRSGVPLVEIVTEPDLQSVEEVDAFVRKIQQTVRYLEISGADMEKGTMRIEPSISILPMSNTTKTTNIKYSKRDKKLPGYRVEIKNINSFKFARKAIEYEIERQREQLEQGEQLRQETRGWSENKGITVAHREKEEAHDYRYFPEPDIPPMRFAQAQISKLKSQIGEMPDAKKERFMRDYQLSEYDATILIETRERAEYYEKSTKYTVQSTQYKDLKPKIIANWIINKKVDVEKVTPALLVDQIAQSMQTSSITDEELKKIVKDVLAQNQKAVDDYKKGKEQSLMFLIGQVIRMTTGRTTAETIKKLLVELLQ
ncbi:Asp-tRNA(Asn)/Glu-tRNA(Gln) amidotransferase subunit GatB [Candidatus Gottesmanbacteria bacterium]|nr:Asp-tRNA(Asn)/Glu-tRNA(Gln) amidotransferase subunit GatB [Candidatus Gottesmanbacteria bacterium]